MLSLNQLHNLTVTEMIEPDYTVEDAQNVMKQFVPCPYEAWQTLFDGPTGKIEMRFTDVGHLLGTSRCIWRPRVTSCPLIRGRIPRCSTPSTATV